MKIGKTIKTVTSPQREIRKATKQPKPIPVQIPQKVES
jgi:hypothetical protein